MIRSYSSGFGRNPSKDDPPKMYRLKVAWWVCMALSVLALPVIDCTILEYYSSQPLIVLLSFGCLMSVSIMGQAAVSNIVATQLKKLMQMEGGDSEHDVGELIYLRRASPNKSY